MPVFVFEIVTGVQGKASAFSQRFPMMSLMLTIGPRERPLDVSMGIRRSEGLADNLMALSLSTPTASVVEAVSDLPQFITLRSRGRETDHHDDHVKAIGISFRSFFDTHSYLRPRKVSFLPFSPTDHRLELLPSEPLRTL